MQPKTFSTLVAVQVRARTLLSRFEIVRQRGRAEGGGATVSTETASLILLRAVGVNHGQFQQLTQPFGFRLPSDKAEYLQMCSAIRRLGHIVESHCGNIASTLRSGGNRAGDSGHYWSIPGGEEDEEPHGPIRASSLMEQRRQPQGAT